MKIDSDDCRELLRSHNHGVLCTVHPERGVDAVPAVYVADADGFVAVPVDQVKAKASFYLQRERNLEADPRAALLIEHWDLEDWTKLWWVRAAIRWQGHGVEEDERAAALALRLSEAFPQYRDRPFSSILLLRVVTITGWSAH